MIEHLVKGCGCPGSTGKLLVPVLPMWPEGVKPRVEGPWSHVRASHWSAIIFWCLAGFWEGLLYSYGFSSPVGWVWCFFIYMTVGLPVLCLTSVRTSLRSFASLLTVFTCWSGIIWDQINWGFYRMLMAHFMFVLVLGFEP